MSVKLEYHQDGDILYISHNDNNEDVYSSLPVGNFVFDVAHSGRIIGLEIDNASKVLGVPADKISKAKNALLGATVKNNMVCIHFMIDLGAKNYEYSCVLPENRTLVSA